MNVIFCKFSVPYNQPLLLELVAELGIKNLYFIGSKSGCPDEEHLTRLGCNLFRFEEEDIFNGLFRDVNWDSIEPIDQSLLNSMAVYEAEIMRLMEKDDQIVTKHDYSHFPQQYYELKIDLRAQNYCSFYNVIQHTYEEKKRKYYRFLRFWNHFLKTRKIDFYIASFHPHFAYEYVLYRLVQKQNIPRVIASHTTIPGRWMVYKDLEKSSESILDYFQALKRGEVRDQQLSDQAAAEVERVTKGVSPYYMNSAFYQNEISSYEYRKLVLENEDRRRLRFRGPYSYTPSLRSRLILLIDKIHFAIRHRSRRNLFNKTSRMYRSLASPDVDVSVPYIYAPLHYQPEASNAPIGGVFANQELIINLAAHHIPDDWLIYVKENPKQGFMHRNPEFYLDLLASKKVRLVPNDFDTFTLIRNSRAIATVAGTAGWEGLFNGIPLLLFGFSPMMYAPGVFNIRTSQDCQQAIQKIVNGFSFNQDELMLFVKALDLASFPAVHDHIQKQKFGYSDDHCIRVMKEAYLEFIKRNFKYKKPVQSENV
jgi:hypothetical protein